MKETKTIMKGSLKYHLKINKGSICTYRNHLSQDATSILIYLKKHMLRFDGVSLWGDPMIHILLTCQGQGTCYGTAKDSDYILHWNYRANIYKDLVLADFPSKEKLVLLSNGDGKIAKLEILQLVDNQCTVGGKNPMENFCHSMPLLCPGSPYESGMPIPLSNN
jgi:hypothetical protein